MLFMHVYFYISVKVNLDVIKIVGGGKTICVYVLSLKISIRIRYFPSSIRKNLILSPVLLNDTLSTTSLSSVGGIGNSKDSTLKR